MDCPVDAVALVSRRLASEVNVEVCPVCSGVWLDAGELDQLRRAHVHDRPLPAPESVAAAYEMAEQEQAPPGPCPNCSEPMDRREYGYFSQVMVDVCPRGHGLWLDAGELERLESFFARQAQAAPEETPLRTLWARFVAALRGEHPEG